LQIEKLNENKIKITLNSQDLKEKNISIHSFMSSSIESQDLFYDVLAEAEKKFGFKTEDYKLMIESLAFPEGNFILTITRFLPKTENTKKMKVKRKNVNFKNNLSIYSFNTFEDYIEFCNYIKIYLNNNTYSEFKNSSLYKYKSKYYLLTNLLNLDTFKSIHCSIIEFATYITNSDLFKRKLIEYGKIIFRTDAVNECIKAF